LIGVAKVTAMVLRRPIGHRLAPTFLWGGGSRQGSRESHHGMLDLDGCLVRFSSQPTERKRVRLQVGRQHGKQWKEFRWIAVAMKVASPLQSSDG
jgi:hypothetical protein